ncbi:MAG: 1-acyl-sn-glycerol-3-phosphate acyltransferase [Halioglobus sp.]
MSDPYSDIRPYCDDEIQAVLQRLLVAHELLDVIARWRFGALARFIPWLTRPLVRWFLARELRNVTDVRSMQMVIKLYMDRMIANSSDGFSVSGLDFLAEHEPYLYMSNHRDIAMDPAFTNYALHRAGRETARIAIGDNLLSKPWVSDLMRLNKSFVVKRSLNGPREFLAATKVLSAYIKHSMTEEGVSVWLAQREGRAKDGMDKTEPAILKMLAMSRNKKEMDFREHIKSLKIVPVAISYELDPCDALKAAELYQLDTLGSYEKGEQEDVASIGQGIAGSKGHVHVSFGVPLDADAAADLDSPESVAAEVDRQVLQLYCLHPTNLYAYRMLHGEDAVVPDGLYFEEGVCSGSDFEDRINAMPEAHRPYALGIYANAVSSKLNLAANSC